ncbi:MAG: hypothetical protein LQ340_001910 [Diploschistes diacapsis]|nr:MAG: hypothetical protein LQ340_001910 [Diploschistes diacapsis]
MKKPAQPLLHNLSRILHPPLPLNPRESNKLLGLLNSSFRQQLNGENDENQSQKQSPVNAHLQSVLSSPLFRGPTKREKAKPRSKQSLNGLISEIQETLINPMEYFEEQVAAGEATLKLAKHCLTVHKQNRREYRNTIAYCRKESSVSQPITNWLWASGLEESMEFARDGAFLKLLVPRMVAEGKDSRLWDWLQRLETRIVGSSNESHPELLESFALLLCYFLTGMVSARGSPDATIQTFTAAARKFKHLFQSYAETAFRPARVCLVKHIMRTKSADINASVYEEFQSVLKQSRLDSISLRARLALWHPTNADASLALDLIRNRAIDKMPSARLTPAKKRSHLYLCLKTAETLLEKGRSDEAREVINYIRVHPQLYSYVEPEHSVSIEEWHLEDEEQDFGLASLAM